MEDYSLYSKKQLIKERSIGLVLSDEQNKNFYKPSQSENIVSWTIEEFEKYLATKHWDDTIKHYHRVNFTGLIKFQDGGFDHLENDSNEKSKEGYSFIMDYYDVKIKKGRYVKYQLYHKNFPAYTKINPNVLDDFMSKGDIEYRFKW